jgi:hypothetical protein
MQQAGLAPAVFQLEVAGTRTLISVSWVLILLSEIVHWRLLFYQFCLKQGAAKFDRAIDSSR